MVYNLAWHRLYERCFRYPREGADEIEDERKEQAGREMKKSLIANFPR